MIHLGMKCWEPGCTAFAVVRPVLFVFAKPKPGCLVRLPDAKPMGPEFFDQGFDGPERYAIRNEVAIQLCSPHAETWDWKKAINEEAFWSAMENQLRQLGYAPPSKDDLKLVWEPATNENGLDEVGQALVDLRLGRTERQLLRSRH